jgi:hypothetical protein
VLAAAVLIMVGWLGSTALAWYRNAELRTPLTVDGVCKDFSRNPDEARKKYVGGVLELSGKIKLVKKAKEIRVSFQSAGAADWSIQCRFEDQKRQLAKVFENQELTISGDCRYRPEEGKVVLLEDCVITKGL